MLPGSSRSAWPRSRPARGHTLAQTRAARVRAERKLSAYLRTVDPPLDDPPSDLAPALSTYLAPRTRHPGP